MTSKNGSPRKRRSRNLKCFNCGGPRLVYNCDADDFDPDKVEENRHAESDKFESKREQSKHRLVMQFFRKFDALNGVVREILSAATVGACVGPTPSPI